MSDKRMKLQACGHKTAHACRECRKCFACCGGHQVRMSLYALQEEWANSHKGTFSEAERAVAFEFTEWVERGAQ